MTKWVVCGSRSVGNKAYTMFELNMVRDVCRVFWKRGDTLITGGCIDIDAYAMKVAKEDGLYVVTLLAVKRDWTDEKAVSQYSDETIETGAGYWMRDTIEVSRGDKVLAFPIHEQDRCGKFSGTWHTWETAKLQNKNTALVILRPRLWNIEGLEAATASQVIVAQTGMGV